MYQILYKHRACKIACLVGRFYLLFKLVRLVLTAQTGRQGYQTEIPLQTSFLTSGHVPDSLHVFKAVCLLIKRGIKQIKLFLQK